MENKRQKIEIADIFRRFEPEYYQKHNMIREQQKAFNDIINCRSQNMGGHTLKCDNCGNVQHAYNSCRNRHCPKCQYLKQVVWVDKLKARWNVFAKPALKNAENVIEYLGRYTHRVAISNARILEIAGNKVHFVWKDYKQNGRTKVMKLEAVEFISRFMLHVLPNGFYKIRYYGIFANIHCNDVLDTYLSMEDEEMVLSLTEGRVWQDIVEEVLGYDPFRCKKCKKGKMLMHEKIDAKPRAA
jgi:hypothetical protein